FELSYRQGMNDILGLLVIAMYPYYHKSNCMSNNINDNMELYLYLFDENQLEADLFALFSSLMERGHKDMYFTPTDIVKNNTPLCKKVELFNNQWEDDTELGLETVEKLHIQKRCEKIFNKIEIIEPLLYDHLSSLNID